MKNAFLPCIVIKNFWLKHSSKIAYGSVYFSDYLSTLPKENFSWPPQYRRLITEFNLKNILEEYWTGSNSISSLLSYLATILIPRESRNSWNQCGIVVKHIGSIVRWTQVQTVYYILAVWPWKSHLHVSASASSSVIIKLLRQSCSDD